MAYRGITARNDEQKHLFQSFENDTPYFAITGPAGTGKTLLAMAYGLHQVFDSKPRFKKDKIIYTRLQVDVGAEIGFLPGTAMEKSEQYFAPFFDNYAKLEPPNQPFGRSDLNNDKIEMMPIQAVRGRTFDNAFVIIDEAQNLDYHTMATLATRLGTNSQMVFLGNFSQIDNEKVKTPETNGFFRTLEALYGDGHRAIPYFRHVNLKIIERSSASAYMEGLLRETMADERFYEMEARGDVKGFGAEVI